MKRSFLLLCLMGLFYQAQAQTQIGVKISPMLSVNRVASDDNNISATSDGVGFRASFGPIVDFFLMENYYFSTGLLYTPKRAGITIRDSGIEQSEDYKLQYLQLPATLKMFTNELALDTRLYFQVGGIPEIKIDEKNTSGDTFVRKFRAIDFSVIAGFGVEYRLGVSSTAFAGISYSRGLINAASKRYENHDFKLKHDLISLDFGLKF
jgi:hypothetical protein